jgi:hypothetical protein
MYILLYNANELDFLWPNVIKKFVEELLDACKKETLFQ